MTSLPPLLCGLPTTNGLGKIALEQLNASLANFSDRTVQYLASAASDEITMFGPFCARVILENGCAALVGRLDPFRILYLSEFQSRPEYISGKRIKSAFSWTGDVIPEEKASLVLWDPDHDVPKISRSLFSAHLEHLYWRPAVDAMLDHIEENPAPELDSMRAIETEKYISEIKGRFRQLYSQLSKGVHWEFFSSNLQMDDVTVKTLLRDTIINIAGLGLISHFVPTAYASLSAGAAVEAYIELRKTVP
ncbi:hypothetical protein HFO45_24540 [Rhizobium leguminosarum]|uniref:hypothetical protein n=1 Tax=Rhizobium leguminosarum TaxID=384 RepID=UPI001C95B7DB|nr:hypothetical protein [Rhizobium leguminosarum]MBY5651398.1 hypothetical protein [Rhizobium leguminosarum]